MLRTTIGVSFILVLGGLAACSSKATDNGNGSAGNGTIVGSSGNSAGGTTGTGNGAGTTGTTGGKTSTAGTGGLEAGDCTDETVTCVDATHAMGCNFDTGVVDTFSCVDELTALGFVSSGCTTDATGDFCAIDDYADAACKAGTAAFAYCENATTDEQLFNIYVNCYQNNMDGHTVIPCFANYVTATMKTSADCGNAEAACLPGAGGAGPIDTGTAGAGGAP
jgi:hypothetical protein